MQPRHRGLLRWLPGAPRTRRLSWWTVSSGKSATISSQRAVAFGGEIRRKCPFPSHMSIHVQLWESDPVAKRSHCTGMTISVIAITRRSTNGTMTGIWIASRPLACLLRAARSRRRMGERRSYPGVTCGKIHYYFLSFFWEQHFWFRFT